MIEDGYEKMEKALKFYANGDHIRISPVMDSMKLGEQADIFETPDINGFREIEIAESGTLTRVEIEDGKVARDYLALVDRDLALEPFQGAVRIDDWLSSHMFIKDQNLAYAVFCFEIWRMPAMKYYNFDKLPEVLNLELYCDYYATPESEPVTRRVTGAGSMGDVWLRKDFKRTDGYDRNGHGRVEVTQCSNWRRVP